MRPGDRVGKKYEILRALAIGGMGEVFYALLRSDISGGEGILDAAAIAQVSAESWPLIRDADELHDALLTLIAMPEAEEHRHWYRDGWRCPSR